MGSEVFVLVLSSLRAEWNCFGFWLPNFPRRSRVLGCVFIQQFNHSEEAETHRHEETPPTLSPMVLIVSLMELRVTWERCVCRNWVRLIGMGRSILLWSDQSSNGGSLGHLKRRE